ncbi:uncharacterized protein L969DRAFT_90552 [Mixia osmundae IAM 14324]|uniref:uncharacterized protein n=1 Tax=Mixia osmundae (strain CBS 9802 / IAM 14324 / JCM 22182 / KY 12970) TaxID=764103 RepID=UPI0004A54C23|nr:uncharacterized protein L969DRAFT_90552 [Mixia osmundae IAM 14324]KEI36597.1 hypothetical protein L969DRAFT_90552 [Mixia osmundae IAM 14324]
MAHQHPSSSDDPAVYFTTLPAIRERCRAVFDIASANRLQYWNVDLSQQDAIVDFCCALIERDYGNKYASIPPHGRMRHFVGDRLTPLLERWQDQGRLEACRKIVDLLVVSVLLDAGAGSQWTYRPKQGTEAERINGIGRSEGLAVASLEMFEQGTFSGKPDDPYRVDALGLSKISTDVISQGLQVNDENCMTGIEGRANVLVRLGQVLLDPENQEYFRNRENVPGQLGLRPGNLIDYLLSHPEAKQMPSATSLPISLPVSALWTIITQGLGGVWPASRTKIDGKAIGDVWPCESLRKRVDSDTAALVPFHKLSQWLCYSLQEAMQSILGWQFEGTEHQTGLPEYRNGGLLVDFGLLTIKPEAVLQSLDKPVPSELPRPLDLPPLPASHSAIVEFRAVTVIMLDRIAEAIRAKLGTKLSLAQVLEAATWKAVRASRLLAC